MIINIITASGKNYAVSKLVQGDYQYEDRLYQFDYVPSELCGADHIKTHGNDKMFSEHEECFSFESDCDIEVYVIYPDIHKELPVWLESYERVRMNVTRMDSTASNLKGYFSLYKKVFHKGKIVLYGCSPEKMLAEEWYVESGGATYCMYSVCVKPLDISEKTNNKSS